MVEFNINNNDLTGTVPSHSATQTDATVGSTLEKSNLGEKWRKFTLDEKCPNRINFAVDKMFTETLLITLPVLIGGIVLILCFFTCFIYICLRKSKKSNEKKKKKSDISTQYDKEHYKIDIYLCKPSEYTLESEEIIRNLRSTLKERKIEAYFPSLESGKLVNDDKMFESAAVLILFSQQYLDDMSDDSTQAFAEITAADFAGQWVIFGCLESKIFKMAKTVKLLESEYYMFDISSLKLLEQNIDQVLGSLYSAQGKKNNYSKQKKKKKKKRFKN